PLKSAAVTSLLSEARVIVKSSAGNAPLMSVEFQAKAGAAIANPAKSVTVAKKVRRVEQTLRESDGSEAIQHTLIRVAVYELRSRGEEVKTLRVSRDGSAGRRTRDCVSSDRKL